MFKLITGAVIGVVVAPYVNPYIIKGIDRLIHKLDQLDNTQR